MKRSGSMSCSSSDDNDDEEPPPMEFKKLVKGRQSVSAEAFGEWNRKKAFTPPKVAKTEAQKMRLKVCLMKSFLFSNLDDSDLSIVIGAMKEVPAEKGTTVITQGEDGDCLFVIESGKFDCTVKSGGQEKLVKSCEVGDVFGELALLYNCPRAASVTSTKRGVLWQLDRETFNHIVKEAAHKKRVRYDAFLAKVSILESMDAYERSQLADALKAETFTDGQCIVTAGDAGDKFYIVEEGKAEAVKSGQVAMQFGVGDYFGELALIRDQPRAATVTAKGYVRVLSVDRRSFKRLLNVEDLINRSVKYM